MSIEAAAAAGAPEDTDRGRDRGGSNGIVVRNTFIDVCPLEEESDRDGSSSAPSPRRNASAPPSPTRTRAEPTFGELSGGEDGDARDGDDEGEGTAGFAGRTKQGEVSTPNTHKSGEDEDQSQLPEWLRKAPGSPPKKTATDPKKRSRRKSREDEKAKPALGEFLKKDGYALPRGPSTEQGGFYGASGGPPTAGHGGAEEVGNYAGRGGGNNSNNNNRGGNAYPSNSIQSVGVWSPAPAVSYDREAMWQERNGMHQMMPVQDYGATACRPVLTHHPGVVAHDLMPAHGWHARELTEYMVDPYQSAMYGDYDPSGYMEPPAYIYGGGAPTGGAAPVLASQPLPTHTGLDAGRRKPYNEYDSSGYFGGRGYPVGRGGGNEGAGGRGRRSSRGSDKGNSNAASAAVASAPWLATPGISTMSWMQPKGHHDEGGGRNQRQKGGGKNGGGNNSNNMNNSVNNRDDSSPGGTPGGGNRVPLSGGGPKRTDYIKKYGGPNEGKEGTGSVPITTMMLKNIPCRKSQDEVMNHIDQQGFGGKYDFFYLPRDVKFRANLGYAFINFVTPEDASAFQGNMHGYRFTGSGSTKACQVVPAHVQGLINNLAAFKRTEVMRSSRKPFFQGAPEVVVA
mmetsp:Transcript_35944/g.77766  ORF Transcript_35944/g.77766 Transcript_35944/m.77766 type:complete len:623 (+) Transcript_35944:606-2474(+)|eukprot:CAMPEP_0206445512 /NCGR_PEP_ID=MMETSP0324_2-20121206/15562_1 /ASSEMBLY_ACC=CAM_ASM_000836 /TAXON_ID=2866 /ORGANISM="Crypthecodinium cohnii, Strain Seligo" /LENGTH=622 /DNA_ID=CAMNT_0053913761 /DNA_START=519 /DNA_END=2387 /DNA_ORIENTATION=-